MIDPAGVALLTAALLLATVAQRIVGMGFGLVMGPVAAIVAGPIAAVPIICIYATLACALMTPGVWRDVDWRRLLWLLVPALPASVAGLLLARVVSADVLRIAVGLVAIAGVIVSVAFTRSSHMLDGPATRITAGGSIGFLNAAVGVGAPLVGIYTIVSRWDPRPMSATMQPYWVVLSLMTLVERQVLVPDGFPEWPWWAWAVPAAACVVGTLFAHRIAHLVPARAARTAIIVLSILGGAAVIINGAIGLAGAP